MFRLCILAFTVALALLPASCAADPKPIEPFNGKDLKGWKTKDPNKNKWGVGGVELGSLNPQTLAVSTPTGKDPLFNLVSSQFPSSDIYTEEKYGDVTVELEFMIPKGSNSGVYLMGEYEIQIIDSFGKPDDQLKPGDMGGIYTFAAPKKNVCKKPGEWQKFVIEFQAPKFEGDKKTANAKFIKVTFNDTVIHENVEAKQQTPGGLTGKESATGPLMFQGDHGQVAFRNIKITPKK